MTNKTPIQELIDFCVRNTFNSTLEDGTKMLTLDYDELKETFDSLVKKEKAFAFDCWQSGYDTAVREEHGSVSTTFYQFYEKYAEQHNK